MLTPALLDHFKAPRNVGRVEGATGKGRAENAACGDVIEIEVRVVDERIEAIAFLAQGCSATLACGSYVTERARRSTTREVHAFDPDDLLREVGETSAARRHAMAQAVRALHEALGSH